MKYGRPQVPNEMKGPFSNITTLASFDSEPIRAAAVAPPATPPMITIFIYYRLRRRAMTRGARYKQYSRSPPILVCLPRYATEKGGIWVRENT